MMNRTEPIATLNSLIETCRDGEQGFSACAEQVTDGELKAKLAEHARRCADSARELQYQVKKLGGNPETSGSTSGKMHRGWANVKATIMGHNDLSVMGEVEIGESAALKSYRSALETDLPPDVREIVKRQYQGVEQNYREVHELRERATPPRSPR